MSYTVLNFDYLEYFFKTKKLDCDEIINSKKKALARLEFTTKVESKIQDAEKVTQDLQK